MTQLNDLVVARLHKWKEPSDEKPKITFDLKKTLPPNVDKADFNMPFKPSNKVPALRRYKMQSMFQKAVLDITKNNDFSRVMGNKIELDVFETAVSANEYEALCINMLKKFSELNRLNPQIQTPK